VNEICATIWKYFQLAHLSHIYVLCRSSVLYALGVLLFASSACAQQQCTSNNAGQCVQAGPITTNGCSINPLEVVALQATLAATDPVAALAANCADPNNPACGKYTNFSNFPLLGPTSANGPCDHHDYCYASCWALSSDGTFTKHKSTCDAAFASELQTVCDTAELLGDSPAVIRACRFFARAYSGVKLVSASTYANDQAQACLFCPGPPPDNSGCWTFSSTAAGAFGAYVWTCPDRTPPSNGGTRPSAGCWHWDASVGAQGAWVADICGGPPSDRNPNPPITVIGVVGQAGDPNDKQGAQGAGLAHYLSGNEQLRYAVLFQNVPTASAAARTVVIQDSLDASSVDLTKLRLGPITFGTHAFAPPPLELASTGTYTTNLDLRPTENLGLQVTASFNSSTGSLTWTLTTLDPVTGMPPADPLAGFLAQGEEGSVLFSVAPKSGTATNTELTNMATIVFDANPPINTPVWSNLIDSTPPTSAVSPLPASEPATGFVVSWSGTDAGSGIRDFTIYASDNGGPFTPFQTNTTATSATFTGQIGHTYGFYSVARDLVGNGEAPKPAAETTTGVVLVTDSTPPTTTASLTPEPNAAGWNNSDVTVALHSEDDPGGTGVKQITYSASGAQTIASTTLVGNSTSFTISAEGITIITFFGTDNAGNAETPRIITIKLDKTPPSINAVLTPLPNANGWNNSDITVSFTCTDALSGLAAGSPPAPAVFSTEGANQSGSGACQDLAGNSASATVSGINIDKTPPTVACSVSPNVFWPPNNKLVPVGASITTTDSLSGSAGFNLLSVTSNEADSGEGDIQGFLTGTPSVSGQLRAQRLGSGTGRVYTLTYSGTDRAGNSAPCMTTVSVPHDRFVPSF
jgi:hypothetical protein